MKKKILLSLLVMVGLIAMTGCGTIKENKVSSKEKIKVASNSETDEKKKEQFTKSVSLEDISIEYKLPENSTSEYDFEDMGCTIILDVAEYESDDNVLHINDSKAENIDTFDINGYSYEHYKYSVDDGVAYVYRTKANDKYYLIRYNVYGSDYDDSQVEKFISTVVYK